MVKKIKVLMITGVYLPEFNGAVLQCSQLIKLLSGAVTYSVFTGTKENENKINDYETGIIVDRIKIFKNTKINYFKSLLKLNFYIIKRILKVDIIHLHGFSKRNSFIIVIGLIFGKKIIIKMTSYGHDDPLSIKKNSYLLWSIFKCCHAYIGISPIFFESYEKAKLAKHKYNYIPNGVDLEKFYPINENQKDHLRRKYGFLKEDKLIIFVGHFSLEKRPKELYQSWAQLIEKNIITKLILIGHTNNHHEVDEMIINEIKNDAIKKGIIKNIHFIEETLRVDEYLKISDVFVITSSREGLPNALLEAMACSLPCVVINLPGVTDSLIDDNVNGVLFDFSDTNMLTDKIQYCLKEYEFHKKMGSRARSLIEDNFSIVKTSKLILALYKKILN